MGPSSLDTAWILLIFKAISLSHEQIHADGTQAEKCQNCPLSTSKIPDSKNYFKKYKYTKNYSVTVTLVNIMRYFPPLRVRYFF